MPKSRAVLSSGLRSADELGHVISGHATSDIHLPSSENETLLRWGHAGLLLDLLLDAGDLCGWRA